MFENSVNRGVPHIPTLFTHNMCTHIFVKIENESGVMSVRAPQSASSCWSAGRLWPERIPADQSSIVPSGGPFSTASSFPRRGRKEAFALSGRTKMLKIGYVLLSPFSRRERTFSMALFFVQHTVQVQPRPPPSPTVAARAPLFLDGKQQTPPEDPAVHAQSPPLPTAFSPVRTVEGRLPHRQPGQRS